ncbi:hypothetical protein GCM10010260_60520 [Streptomyces filipinensis]|uniref:Uncharacterized protein n=1 Tax=Streptomyces filipinensis TaxID=66887 RepID=A0A918MEH2_9ACTN|nr:hypothetical protein GCM10010260_60520 [Streptomyces filipinensis]
MKGWNAGGVGRQTPGAREAVKGTSANLPSPYRSSMMRAAARFPWTTRPPVSDLTGRKSGSRVRVGGVESLLEYARVRR